MAGAWIPEAQFLPAAHFRNASFREWFQRPLRNIDGGALTTGVIVTVVNAILPIWIQ